MEMLFVAVTLLIFLTALFLAAPLPALWLVSGIGLIGLQRLSRRFLRWPRRSQSSTPWM